MISVNGEKIVLEGSEIVLQKEITYLLGTFKSRVMATGQGIEIAAELITAAAVDAGRVPLDDLRSDAKMTAESERLSKRQ